MNAQAVNAGMTSHPGMRLADAPDAGKRSFATPGFCRSFNPGQNTDNTINYVPLAT